MARSVTVKDFKLTEFCTKDFTYPVPQSHEYSDILQPGYWAHVAPLVALPGEKTLGYTITAIREDHAWYAKLAVIRTTANDVVVKPIQFIDWAGEEGKAAEVVQEVDAGDYQIKWGGPHALYRIVRKSDKAVVADKLATKEDADLALEEYKRKIAA